MKEQTDWFDALQKFLGKPYTLRYFERSFENNEIMARNSAPGEEATNYRETKEKTAALLAQIDYHKQRNEPTDKLEQELWAIITKKR